MARGSLATCTRVSPAQLPPTLEPASKFYHISTSITQLEKCMHAKHSTHRCINYSNWVRREWIRWKSSSSSKSMSPPTTASSPPVASTTRPAKESVRDSAELGAVDGTATSYSAWENVSSGIGPSIGFMGGGAGFIIIFRRADVETARG